MKLGRIQRRVMEIGMVGRIAHNLAKYSVSVEGAYSETEFLFEVHAYMMDCGVELEQINTWIETAKIQAQTEINFFLANGTFSESHGGTAVTVETLIGPILDELGYTNKIN